MPAIGCPLRDPLRYRPALRLIRKEIGQAKTLKSARDATGHFDFENFSPVGEEKSDWSKKTSNP